MGTTYSAYVSAPETTPKADAVPTFDSALGFENGRKERVMVATKEEMQAANVDGVHRDYCAHTYINFMSCKKDNFPFVYKCKHQLHDHEQCEFDDYVLRMKEFEREKRLKIRDQRISSSQQEQLTS